MQLVDLTQVRAHCRADPAEDVLLTTYADSAEQQVQDFLNRRVFKDAEAMADAVLQEQAGDDPMLVNAVIQAAVLLLAAHLYRHREAVTVDAVHELPLGVTQMLWPHRVGLGI